MATRDATPRGATVGDARLRWAITPQGDSELSWRSNKNGGGAYLRVFRDGPVKQIDVVCEDSEEVVSVEAARPAAVLQEPPVRKSEWSGRDSWVSRNPNNRPLACSRGTILSLGYGGVLKDSGL